MPIQQTKHIYNLATTKQLIDINHDAVNFQCQFSVASKDGKPFQASVVNQSILDNSDQFDFQDVDDGHFSGDLRADRNVYQNFFLLMKAPAPTAVEVTLNFEQLPDYIPNGKGTLVDSKIIGGSGNMKIWGGVLLTCVIMALIWHYAKVDHTTGGSGGVGGGGGGAPITAHQPRSVLPDLAPRSSLLADLKKIPIE